jgi:hypothetical protein|tara:strand:+ start:404 stop:628 length:225 start_codon:yes stop_codon:yes gene_type:complete
MEPEQIKQLTSMIKSDDHDNLVVAMAIIFNLSDEQADSKTDLYKLVIDMHSWGKFIELYKKNVEIYEPESLASQ